MVHIYGHFLRNVDLYIPFFSYLGCFLHFPFPSQRVHLLPVPNMEQAMYPF